MREPSTRLIVVIASAGALALDVVACGGRSTSGTSPSPTPSPGGGAVDSSTITIVNNAVSPKNITVTRGSQVTFVNNDTQAHDMESDPHPTHGLPGNQPSWIAQSRSEQADGDVQYCADVWVSRPQSRHSAGAAGNDHDPVKERSIR